jgi:A/G-specific adenine glycosylase
VLAGEARSATADGVWVPLDRLGEHALPSVMKKVIAHARDAAM